jgi:hypothetical protein
MKKRHSQYMSLFILEHFLTHTGEKPLKCDSCYRTVCNSGPSTRL